jgi:hypothetical protein
MYRLETKDGKVLGRGFDLTTARSVKQRVHTERGIWLNIVKQ